MKTLFRRSLTMLMCVAAVISWKPSLGQKMQNKQRLRMRENKPNSKAQEKCTKPCEHEE